MTVDTNGDYLGSDDTARAPVRARGVDSRILLPVVAANVSGRLSFDEADKQEIARRIGGLIEEEPARTWASCEEQIVLEFAAEKLAAAGLEVAEAEPL